MALDIDPIYHTETMVRILCEQGSTLNAMELAEKILENDPENASVRKLLDEMKVAARESFERFRQAGTTKSKNVVETVPEPETEEVLSENNVVSLEEKREARDPNLRKVERLKRLLIKIQGHRQTNG